MEIFEKFDDLCCADLLTNSSTNSFLSSFWSFVLDSCLNCSRILPVHFRPTNMNSFDTGKPMLALEELLSLLSAMFRRDSTTVATI